jgi:hypothetical protein
MGNVPHLHNASPGLGCFTGKVGQLNAADVAHALRCLSRLPSS